jgi:hypothetical protein
MEIRHCTGCGLPLDQCQGACRRELDPPRFCPECGRRLVVMVTPGYFEAQCKVHGPLP